MKLFDGSPSSLWAAFAVILTALAAPSLLIAALFG